MYVHQYVTHCVVVFYFNGALHESFDHTQRCNSIRRFKCVPGIEQGNWISRSLKVVVVDVV